MHYYLYSILNWCIVVKMRISLCQLLAAITGDSAYHAGHANLTPAFAQVGGNGQGELFDDPARNEIPFPEPDKADIAVMTALHTSTGMDAAVLSPRARLLFELSADAFEAIVHAWMSEHPITAEIIRFGQKILTAANAASGDEDAQRRAADKAATDRGDTDVQAVQGAAYKVWHEIHRLLGLLRFSPDEDGVYIARCEPDHLVLPALGPHFRERFGQTPWVIIDEKRGLGMSCSGASPNTSIEFFFMDKNHAPPEPRPDNEWENMWRNYHKTINNESRNNPDLQKRFMPKRYWKYLTEL